MTKQFLVLFLFITFLSVGQTKKDTLKTSDPDYNRSKRTQFPGGTTEMLKWINKTMIKPDTVKNGLDGRVNLWFQVSAEGVISSIRVLDSLKGCPACTKEAIRIVENMPKWDPELLHNKPVKTDFNFGVNFHPPKK